MEQKSGYISSSGRKFYNNVFVISNDVLKKYLRVLNTMQFLKSEPIDFALSKRLKEGYNYVVRYDSKLATIVSNNLDSYVETLYGIRLALNLFDEDSKYLKKDYVDKNNIFHETYGEYIKNYVNSLSELGILDKALVCGYLLPTGKSYTIIDYSISKRDNISFKKVPEVSFGKNKYVGIDSNCTSGYFSSEPGIVARLKQGKKFWFDVKPLEWLYIEDVATRIGANTIFAAPDYGFSSSDVNNLIENLSLEIMSTEQLIEKKIIEEPKYGSIEKLSNEVKEFLINSLSYFEALYDKNKLSEIGNMNDLRDLSLLLCYVNRIMKNKDLFLEKGNIELKGFKNYLSSVSLCSNILFNKVELSKRDNVLYNIFENYLCHGFNEGRDLSLVTINDVIANLFKGKIESNYLLDTFDKLNFNIDEFYKLVSLYSKERIMSKSKDTLLCELQTMDIVDFSTYSINDIFSYGSSLSSYMTYATNDFFRIVSSYSKDITDALSLKDIINNLLTPTKPSVWQKLFRKNTDNNYDNFMKKSNLFVNNKIESYKEEIQNLLFLKEFIKQYIVILNNYMNGMRMKLKEIDLLDNVDDFMKMEADMARDNLEDRLASYEQALLILVQEYYKILSLISVDYRYLTRLDILQSVLMPYISLETYISSSLEGSSQLLDIMSSMSSFLDNLISNNTKELQEINKMSMDVSLQPQLLDDSEREKLEIEVKQIINSNNGSKLTLEKK